MKDLIFATLLVVVFMTVAFLVSGCSDKQGATRALEGLGYTNIETHGYSFLDSYSCSKDDWYVTKFNALGPTGVPVSGVVCSGFLFKGSTVRFH